MALSIVLYKLWIFFTLYLQLSCSPISTQVDKKNNWSKNINNDGCYRKIKQEEDGDSGYFAWSQAQMSSSPHFIDCLWELQASHGQKIQLDFAHVKIPQSQFSSRCLVSYIMFGSYDYRGRKIIQETFCKDVSNKSSYVSRSNKAWVHFILTNTSYLQPHLDHAFLVDYTFFYVDLVRTQLAVGLCFLAIVGIFFSVPILWHYRYKLQLRIRYKQMSSTLQRFSDSIHNRDVSPSISSPKCTNDVKIQPPLNKNDRENMVAGSENNESCLECTGDSSNMKDVAKRRERMNISRVSSAVSNRCQRRSIRSWYPNQSNNTCSVSSELQARTPTILLNGQKMNPDKPRQNLFKRKSESRTEMLTKIRRTTPNMQSPIDDKYGESPVYPYGDNLLEKNYAENSPYQPIRSVHETSALSSNKQVETNQDVDGYIPEVCRVPSNADDNIPSDFHSDCVDISRQDYIETPRSLEITEFTRSTILSGESLFLPIEENRRIFDNVNDLSIDSIKLKHSSPKPIVTDCQVVHFQVFQDSPNVSLSRSNQTDPNFRVVHDTDGKYPIDRIVTESKLDDTVDCHQKDYSRVPMSPVGEWDNPERPSFVVIKGYRPDTPVTMKANTLGVARGFDSLSPVLRSSSIEINGWVSSDDSDLLEYSSSS